MKFDDEQKKYIRYAVLESKYSYADDYVFNSTMCNKEYAEYLELKREHDKETGE